MPRMAHKLILPVAPARKPALQSEQRAALIPLVRILAEIEAKRIVAEEQST